MILQPPYFVPGLEFLVVLSDQEDREEMLRLASVKYEGSRHW
jgi:hypothetical protein